MRTASARRRFGLLALLLCLCAVVLSGCEADTSLHIYPDQTYTMHSTLAVPVEAGSQLTCTSLKNLLLQAGGQGQTRVEDKSTKQEINCVIDFTKPQPIANSGSPFVTITHYSGRYRVSLPGDPSYSSIVEGAQFKFSITFPGPVTDISGSYGAKADGNTVTWTNPRVLNTGFTVEGRDNAGFSLSQVVIWALTALVLLSALGTSRALGRPDSFKKIQQRWRAFWIPTRPKIIAALDKAKQLLRQGGTKGRQGATKAGRSIGKGAKRAGSSAAKATKKAFTSTSKFAKKMAERASSAMKNKKK
ncbi:MAG: hypothetical protein E7E09_06030 [Winkia neuii]|uniref:LppM family (lipo)protein n=1 Tax=Winkia neuii TaxID=33007 RepID=UPI002900658C|nr:hypothetical protein [Winkia neuii]MDU2269457.1 hypothetical protein [Winkia neuii]MDU5161924.1 hypothetical protein [Winkia neuii]